MWRTFPYPGFLSFPLFSGWNIYSGNTWPHSHGWFPLGSSDMKNHKSHFQKCVLSLLLSLCWPTHFQDTSFWGVIQLTEFPGGSETLLAGVWFFGSLSPSLDKVSGFPSSSLNQHFHPSPFHILNSSQAIHWPIQRLCFRFFYFSF